MDVCVCVCAVGVGGANKTGVESAVTEPTGQKSFDVGIIVLAARTKSILENACKIIIIIITT